MESQSEISFSSYYLMPKRRATHRRRNNRLLFSTEDVREFLFVLPKFLCSEVLEIIGGKLCGEDPASNGCYKIKFHIQFHKDPLYDALISKGKL